MDFQGDSLGCTDILPYEAWEAIIDKVDSLEDLRNCSRTCRDWRNIILTNIGRATLLLSRVIPILWLECECLSAADILTCRLVCRRWRNIVDTSTSLLLPTPYSNWKIFYELKFKSRCGDLFDESKSENDGGDGGGGGGGGGAVQYASYTLDDRPSLHFVKHPYSEERLMHGDPSFLNILNSLEYDPCHTKSLEYRLDITPSLLYAPPTARQDHLDSIQYANGRRGWCLLYDSVDDAGTLVKYLTSLFHHFPALKSLNFRVSTGSRYERRDVKRLDEIEQRILAQVEMLRRNDGIQLKHLKKLALGIGGRYSRLETFPHLISALIANSPRLEQVGLLLASEAANAGSRQRQGLGVVLESVARAGTVTTLELCNWAEELRLGELLPPGIPTSLHKLSIWLKLSHAESTAAAALRTFLGVLGRLSGSLEELHIQTEGGRCYELHFGRVCRCNELCYSRFKSYKAIPEFQQFIKGCGGKGGGGGIMEPFGKLKLLTIPHALLHPAVFPGLMKCCPVISELRIIYDRSWANTTTNNNNNELNNIGPELKETVGQLWTQVPPPLRLIVSVCLVDSQGGRRSIWSYRCSRRVFEKGRKWKGAVYETVDRADAVGSSTTKQTKKKSERKCLLL